MHPWHCGGGGVVVVVVGVTVVVVAAAVVVVSGPTVVVVVVVVVVVAADTRGRRQRGGCVDGPFTVSQPVFPGPEGAAPPIPDRVHAGCGRVVDPHRVSRDAVVVRGRDRGWARRFRWRRRMPACVAADDLLHVSVPFESPVLSANETTRIPTFPGSIVFESTVASPSSRTMPSKRLS